MCFTIEAQKEAYKMKKSILTFCSVILLSTGASIANAEDLTQNKEIKQYENYNHSLLSWSDSIIKAKLDSIKLTFKKNDPVEKSNSVIDKKKPVQQETAKKQEVIKQEAPKQEVAKQEAPKQEVTKQEAPKQEVTKQEAPKQEVTKQETPEQENVTTPVEKTETTVQSKEETQSVQQPSTSSDIDVIEAKVVELTNAERAKHGLQALQADVPLMAAAREKSQDMKNHNYFSHTSPTFGSPFDRLNALGISYKSAGENIAKGQQTAEQVVQAWMDSEGHRANILNSDFTHIGVGYVKDGHIWTQQFIKK